MSYLYANNAVATLAAGIGTSDTSITLTAGLGAKFPTLSAGNVFQATLYDAATNAVIEIIQVTARSTDLLTVIRAQEGTTPNSYLIGDGLALRVTAAELTDFASKTTGATFSGTLNAPTVITGDSSTSVATTAFVATGFASLTSPTFVGLPKAPTATTGTNTTQIATTAFVVATSFASALPNQSGNSGKFVTTDGTNASWSQVYPTQTGQAGKYLTTNGTTTSWGTITIPVATGSILYLASYAYAL